MELRNNHFTQNSATVQGGALFTQCDSPAYDCKLMMTGTHTFERNSAGVSGGALYWNDVEPLFE